MSDQNRPPADDYHARPMQRAVAASRNVKGLSGQEFYDSLGQNGRQRAATVYQSLTAVVGKEHAAALEDMVDRPEHVVALEKMLHAALLPLREPASVAPRSPGPTSDAARAAALAKLTEKQRDPRYWRDHDRAFIAEVEEGFARLYPGRRRTAHGPR